MIKQLVQEALICGYFAGKEEIQKKHFCCRIRKAFQRKRTHKRNSDRIKLRQHKILINMTHLEKIGWMPSLNREYAVTSMIVTEGDMIQFSIEKGTKVETVRLSMEQAIDMGVINFNPLLMVWV